MEVLRITEKGGGGVVNEEWMDMVKFILSFLEEKAIYYVIVFLVKTPIRHTIKAKTKQKILLINFTLFQHFNATESLVIFGINLSLMNL